ncbi:DMT family transporter [Pyrodictium abyssi]|uniref:EamA domain-containing protein n=1 Tax=Pyrodictium abyssi TaxID=54256 RepID=A0ABM8IY58_9CREN|nr:hypothetical protein PABY_20430 [Pyrodictium abyssi]
MELRGLAAVIVAVAAWSLAPAIVSRASLKVERVNPWAFNGWRMLIAALATIPLAYVYEGFPLTTPWLDPVFELGVWLGGVFATILGDGLFVYSVSRIGAGITMPISYLFVIWTSLYDYFRGMAGENVLLAAALALAGIWIVSTSSGGRPSPSRRYRLSAIAAAIATSFIWGASMYAYQAALEKAGYLSVASARAIFTVLVLLYPILTWRDASRVAVEIAASSLLGYVVGALAFLVALSLMPASIVAIGLALSPITTQLIVAPIAKERIEQRLLVGGALITAALILANIEHVGW